MPILRRLLWRGKATVKPSTHQLDEIIKNALRYFKNPKIVDWKAIKSKKSYCIIESSYGKIIEKYKGKLAILPPEDAFGINLSNHLVCCVQLTPYELEDAKKCQICGNAVYFDEVLIKQKIQCNKCTESCKIKDIKKVIISHDHIENSGGLIGIYKVNPNIDIYVPISFDHLIIRHYLIPLA